MIFAGDLDWKDMNGAYFDEATYYPSHNVRDLDTNDVNVHRDVLDILKRPDAANGTRNFDLMVAHLLGIDHGGHAFYANHSEIERKIIETEAVLTDFIREMDNDTVIVLFGDHGMTEDGNHGGGTPNEMKTVVFSYCKSGFPMLKKD